MVIISLELTRVNPDRNIFSINVELTSTFLLYRGWVHHHHWIIIYSISSFKPKSGWCYTWKELNFIKKMLLLKSRWSVHWGLEILGTMYWSSCLCEAEAVYLAAEFLAHRDKWRMQVPSPRLESGSLYRWEFYPEPRFSGLGIELLRCLQIQI